MQERLSQVIRLIVKLGRDSRCADSVRRLHSLSYFEKSSM